LKISFPLREGSLGRNASWMFLGQGLSVFVQAAYFILLARLLGNNQYGIFVGAMALVSIVSQYSSLGSGFVMLRHVSQDKKQFAEYWGNVILTTLVVGSLMILALKLSGTFLVGAASASVLVLIAIGECTCARLSECAGQAFQAHENLRITATLTTLTNVARLAAAGGMTVYLHHATVHQWAIASVSVSLFSAVIAVIAVCTRLGMPRFRPGLLVRSAAEGLGFSFACSTTSVYNDIDKTMLSRYGMAAANGIYSMAYRVVDISCVPIRSVHSAAFPRFCQKGVNGVRGNIEFARKIIQKTVPFALLAAAGMFLCAPLIPLAIGKGFEESVSALRWLCLIPLFRSLHLSAGDSLTGAGYQRYRTGSQVAAAGLNFCLNLYLIPAFSWRGAAWASLLTDGFLAVSNWTVLAVIARREKAFAEGSGCLSEKSAAEMA
jgi:O-antigen/teichoic acid export membrane protein